MNVHKKRSWLVRFFRLSSSAEQKLSNFYHRIPPPARFWLYFGCLVFATAYLIVGKQWPELASWPRLIGMSAVAAVIFFALYKASTRSRSLRLPADTTFWVTGTAILLQLLLVRAGEFVAMMFVQNPQVERYSGVRGFELAIPFATATLGLSLLVGSQIALVAALIIALFVALISQGGMAIAMYSLVGSIAAIASAERYRTRNAVAAAVPVIGVANALMGIVVALLTEQPLSWRIVINSVLLGIISAMQCAGIASLVTPLYESAFGIMTDMKLLELSNADNPLLRDLAIKTPGTNHHSFIVATLAEAAAKAIGANALLTRTACLYHDIGKMAAPKMYIENQNGMENPHNDVDPRASVRIITGHVRRGIKMGEESGLPQQIIDFIPQHHGTRTLHYFLRKAQAQAKPGETVDEADFRYPGPKPQFKEAAIMMLADSCEAAARSLARPDPENIRAIVVKIFDAIISDG
ncbi:MAG TPA: HDIG domain-containing protein, partial [Blastocatellia bacterium]|nr:HDIG domain-containing protein [Blastocatellia bacterium]